MKLNKNIQNGFKLPQSLNPFGDCARYRAIEEKGRAIKNNPSCFDTGNLLPRFNKTFDYKPGIKCLDAYKSPGVKWEGGPGLHEYPFEISHIELKD